MSAKSIAISGSIAYDNILVFEGYFKDHILPDKVHMLNVGFLTPGMRKEFGGTAANIAYNLCGLGAQPLILATLGGNDSRPYIERLESWSVSTEYIKEIEKTFTAQAFITTDLADNQITAFHPGAMNLAHTVGAPTAGLGLVSPNGKEAMHAHAEQFSRNGTPFIFDPGQGLPMFNGDELKEFIRLATAVTVNDYEAQMLCDKTGLSLTDISQQVQALIVTLGAQGCSVYEGANCTQIAAASINQAVDPTGCGDAFRAGLTHGRVNGLGWVDSAKIGSVLGAIKIESPGAQNHSVNRAVVAQRLRANYGIELV
jgi:adenosine kinase